jgi:CRP-like cAMP-binding protein
MILPEELHGIPFFRRLGAPFLNHIALLARLEEAAEGTIIFCEGDSPSLLWFVLGGEVALEVKGPDGEPVEVNTVGPGELLGWSPVLGLGSMTATARAATSCRLAVIDVHRILGLGEQDPRFGMAFFREVAWVLSDRLASTRRCLAAARTR